MKKRGDTGEINTTAPRRGLHHGRARMKKQWKTRSCAEIDNIHTCRMHIIGGEIYHMDQNGEFWNEVSHKKLDDTGLRKARLDEIKQCYAHGVYEMVHDGARPVRNPYR